MNIIKKQYDLVNQGIAYTAYGVEGTKQVFQIDICITNPNVFNILTVGKDLINLAEKLQQIEDEEEWEDDVPAE